MKDTIGLGGQSGLWIFGNPYMCYAIASVLHNTNILFDVNNQFYIIQK